MVGCGWREARSEKLVTKLKTHGFTLLEVIIVLAIITMFFAISVPLFSKFTETAKLDTTARSVTSALRTARSYAISNSSPYNVVFDITKSPNEYYISDGTNVVDKAYKLPIGTKFRIIAGVTSFTFTPTGALEDDTHSEPSIEVASNDDAEWRTITVERTTGRVKIE